MLKGLRNFDRYTRDIFHTGADTYTKRQPPYSSLVASGVGVGVGGGVGVVGEGTTTAPYDWIYRGSGATIMPPLVRPHDPTTSATSYLMGSPAEEDNEVKTKLKCVLVGDGSVGKTSLVVSYTTNGYPTEYVPTAFDNYNVVVNVDNQPIRLQLCDTAGQDDFDSLRPLCYPQTDVFLVCFSVVSPTSFHNVKEKWLSELRQHNPRPPIVLVGTQSDLRTDVKVLIELAQYREQPVSEVAARRLAHQIGAIGYVESSALTQRNLKEVFDQAILAALEARSGGGPSSATSAGGGVLLSRGGSSKRSFSRYRKLGGGGAKDGNNANGASGSGSSSSSSSSSGSNGGVGEPLNSHHQHLQQQHYHHNNHHHHHHNGSSPTTSQHSNNVMLDYVVNEETSRKRGWRKLCCFS